MRCEEIEKLKYLKDNELSAEESEILRLHLQNCEDCRKEYQDISILIQKAEFETPSINTRFLEARVAESIHQYL